jgi:hypothetical protein
VAAPAQAAGVPPGGSVLAQLRRMEPPGRPASWWDDAGPLELVWNGGAQSQEGELLQVRLSQGRGSRPYILHFLAERVLGEVVLLGSRIGSLLSHLRPGDVRGRQPRSHVRPPP